MSRFGWDNNYEFYDLIFVQTQGALSVCSTRNTNFSPRCIVVFKETQTTTLTINYEKAPLDTNSIVTCAVTRFRKCKENELKRFIHEKQFSQPPQQLGHHHEWHPHHQRLGIHLVHQHLGIHLEHRPQRRHQLHKISSLLG